MPTLGQLAAVVQGRVQGDSSIPIHNAATVRWARPGDITLVENERYLKQLASSSASACVIPEELAAHPCLDRPAIVVARCLEAFERIVVHLRPLPRPQFTGVSPQAWIHSRAQLAPNVTVYPGAWIDEGVQIGAGTIIHSGCRIMAGTRIGEECVLFPNVVVYEGTRIGRRVVIHANAVIGAYGFGYTLRDGAYCRSPQVGYVEIQDDVEIGACTTIDRGTFDATVIGQGTKIDNQVMIAHNCHIGRHNLLCSQVGIAGSCDTGDYVIMAGQVGVRDHVHIGTGVRLGAQAGVASDIPDGSCYFGSPARPEREERQILGGMAKIPEMRKQLKRLERLVQQLREHVGLPDEPSGEAAADAA